jgi:hypothetical protein
LSWAENGEPATGNWLSGNRMKQEEEMKKRKEEEERKTTLRR